MKNYNLLLVDDEEEITEIVEDIISNSFSNITIQIANTTKEAAKLMESCDFVISDVNMPDKRILDEAILKYSDQKTIARITGHVDKISSQDLIIQKPFSAKAVRDMVTHMLSLLEKKDIFSDINRIELVKSYKILDTPPEKEFDNLTFLAASISECPIALMGFFDKDREWFKSAYNINVSDVLKENSFCQNIVDEQSPFIVEDVSLDERVSKLPGVVANQIMFYAGFPLLNRDKVMVGQICVVDKKPRKLSDIQVKSLQAIASQAMIVLESRKQKIDDDEMSRWKNSLLNDSSYAIISVNSKREIVTFNPQAERMFGYIPEEVLGKSPDIFHVESEIEQDKVKMTKQYSKEFSNEQVFSHLPDQGASFEKEWTFVKKNRDVFPGVLSLSAIKSSDGKEIIGYIGIIRDITEQKEKDNLIKNQQSVLVQNSKMSSLGEMAAGIGHEINNPLAILIGRCEYMQIQAENGTLNNQGVVESVNKMIATIERIAKIIKGLKAFSRNSEGEEISSQSLNLVLEESLDLCYEKLKHIGIKLTVDCPKDITYMGQGVKMSQVFINLLNNSLDAIQDLPEKWISIKVDQVENKTRIKFIDSGSGIPASVRSKLMTPFFTTKEIGKGTGIGLSLSKAICEQHGGDLFLDHESPNTTFVIELPKE